MSIVKGWKLKLRYGILKTPYKHFTLIAEGIIEELSEGFECSRGNAYMGMKVWASSENEAFEMIQSIGNDIGFKVKGKIHLYKTAPEEPPRNEPYGYGINFHSYSE